MTTNIFCPLFLIGHPRRIFFVFFLAACSPGLFAQSDKAFQVEVGVEQYIETSGSIAAAGGLFVEGKYQKGQFDFGIKAGRPLLVYGADRPTLIPQGNNSFSIRGLIEDRPYFEELSAYFEASVNYKPNFKHAKPFFGIGCRYTLRLDHKFERIEASGNTVTYRDSPPHFTPVVSVGYYHDNIKYQFSGIFSQRIKEERPGNLGIYYPGYFTFGASYIFGVGTRNTPPSYEISLSRKDRTFRPLALRLEAGMAHQIAFGKHGVGSSLNLFLEIKAGIRKNLRIGFRAEALDVKLNHQAMGIDHKSQEIYFYGLNQAYSRNVNSSGRIGSYVLFGEYVLKSTVSKDILLVGAGLGLFKIQGPHSNSYKDNGVTIELPPQLKQANLLGLHLRVGQRFGAFSHSAFVNLIPGQVPVTFGVQLGLGLNIFGKQFK
ncbi:MAG: hypothetical protein ACKV1O_21795 [Saprospiraceae bacterium]